MEKEFGIKKIRFYPDGDAGVNPVFNSPTNITFDAAGQVNLDSEVSFGDVVVSDVIVSEPYRLGIATAQPRAELDVQGDVYVGVDTSRGIVLTSPNGTSYRLVVDDAGNLSTVAV
jgi:hypothetical protein